MTHLYVCHFSNGFIKVGRSAFPTSRIAQHEDRVSCVGVELVEHEIHECVGSSVSAEAALIECCAKHAAGRTKNEWFEGLDFPDVCQWARDIAATTFGPFVALTPLSEYIKAERGNGTKIAAALGVSLSYLSQMAVPDASISPLRCVLIERATGGQVMRWDSRPNDWHLIWPELIGSDGAPPVSEVEAKAA